MIVEPALARSALPGQLRLKQAVTQLARDFSLEVTPADLAQSSSSLQALPPGTRVYITWVPGKPFDAVLQAAVRLREMGLQPVPHLSARAIADGPTLERLLIALRRQAGVTQALLIGGSQRQPAGVLTASLELAASGQFQQQGFTRIAFAAHPDGSPDMAPHALAEALQQKNDWVNSSGMAGHLVTQFCFDASRVVAWEQGTRQRMPIHIGLAGLASLPTLVKYAKNCGIGPSIQTLLRQGGRMVSLANAVAPGRMVVALAQARLQDPQCRIERLHFFPFGALQRTVQWALALTHGTFELVQQDSDIST